MIRTFLLSVLMQLITIFGGFFVLGLALSLLQELIQKNYMRALGWRGILWTAWIGTPIHEFGHIFFLKLFRHRIAKISLFKPNEETGVLGEVEDTYNRRSIYQNIGNFFIGIGSMIFSSIWLAALLYFLVPNHAEVFRSLEIDKLSLMGVFGAVYQTLKELFAVTNLEQPAFWLFLYLSFAIASHMAPSRADLRRVAGGFFTMVVILILLNLLFIFLGFDITKMIIEVATYVNGFLVFFVYALAVSLVHLFFSALILAAARLRS